MGARCDDATCSVGRSHLRGTVGGGAPERKLLLLAGFFFFVLLLLSWLAENNSHGCRRPFAGQFVCLRFVRGFPSVDLVDLAGLRVCKHGERTEA